MVPHSLTLQHNRYTFAPKVNGRRTNERAVMNEATGGVHYMLETQAVKHQFDRNAEKARRLEQQRESGGPTRFSGFGSLFYDQCDIASDRQLGRTSPTEEIPTFQPTLFHHATGHSKIMAPTYSSKINSRVAQMKKLKMEQKKLKTNTASTRFQGVGPGYVISVDESEAEVIFEEVSKRSER